MRKKRKEKKKREYYGGGKEGRRIHPTEIIRLILSSFFRLGRIAAGGKGRKKESHAGKEGVLTPTAPSVFLSSAFRSTSRTGPEEKEREEGPQEERGEKGTSWSSGRQRRLLTLAYACNTVEDEGGKREEEGYAEKKRGKGRRVRRRRCLPLDTST